MYNFNDIENDIKLNDIENDIINSVGSISRNAAAEEVIYWLINNVMEYIDNQKKLFRIDLILNKGQDFPLLNRIQELYESLSDENLGISSLGEKEIDFINKNKNVLNAMVEEIKVAIGKSELLKTLFEKMIFYYEMTGITKRGLIINKLVGEVAIPLFVYDDFHVVVNTRGRKVNQNTGQESDEHSSQEVIMPGFSLELEISFKKEQETASLF